MAKSGTGYRQSIVVALKNNFMRAQSTWFCLFFCSSALLLAFSVFPAAAHGSSKTCFELTSKFSKAVMEGLGRPSENSSSFMEADFPLLDPAKKDELLASIMKEFKITSLADARAFFSQFTFGADGRLHTIHDSTIEKDAGNDIAPALNGNPELRAVLSSIHSRILQLESEIRFVPAEGPIKLFETVLTIQINKDAENWHLDWYPQEYLVATQAIGVWRANAEGIPITEERAGTEYLLSGDTAANRNNGSANESIEIHFDVNAKPKISIEAKGFPYTVRTGALALHSGVRRVSPNFFSKSNPYARLNNVSPPHRGARIAGPHIRISLAVRFVPQ